jgi:D-amino-acid oxidase
VSETISIIGAGVIGSTTGIEIAKGGRRVEVLTDPDETYSAHKGGVGIMEDQGLLPPDSGPLAFIDMKQVNDTGLRAWHQLEGSESWQGIVARRKVTYLSTDPDKDTSFLGDCLPEQNARRLESEDLQAHLRDAGYCVGASFETSIVNTKLAGEQLRREFENFGGRLTKKLIRNYDDVPGDGVIVDTTGLGRRMFLGDERIWGKRGQTLILKGDHGLTEVLSAPGEPISYNLVPIDEQTLLIGATKEEHDYERRADPLTRDSFVREGARIWPAVKKLRVFEDRVCFRPMADRLIVQRFVAKGRRVIVVNGLGGGGWSVCFGLAPYIASLAIAA